MLRIGIRSASLTPRSAVFGSWTVAAALLLALGLGLCGSHADAKPAVVRLDPPSMPSSPLLSPKFEAPVPLDPDVTPRDCAACKAADETTGRIPVDAIRLDSRVLPDGITLRATVADPAARDLLWKAAVARGELVESLRSSDHTHLCTACRARAEMLRELHISARRIPEGIELVYTSASPALVKQIQAALSATQQFPVRF